MTERLSLAEARSIAIAAAGFDRPRPAKPGLSHARAVIHRLGLIQLDFVNVLLPAHYQVLFSRLGPYHRRLLDHLVYRRREFTEQWAHEASIIPVAMWPLLRHRMAEHRARPWGFDRVMEEHADWVATVLDEVRARGPLEAASLEHPGVTASCFDHAWFRSVPRAVLEAYFGRGLLAIAHRHENMARFYDLAERVIPAEHLAREVDPAGARRELIRIAARALGIATIADLADYFRMFVRDARRPVAELAAAGEIIPVRVEGWREPAWLAAGAKPAKRLTAAALLSPFDPLIWFRPRIERLFGFEHRFEIFTPAEKRRWGVYVLPFLMGDRLVARVDLKSDRTARRLCVLASWKEDGIHVPVVAEALAAELRTLAAWLDLEKVTVARKGDFARQLAAAVRGAAPCAPNHPTALARAPENESSTPPPSVPPSCIRSPSASRRKDR